MARVQKLRIPKLFHSGISTLLSLENSTYSTLTECLQKAEPSLYRGDLVSYIADKVPMDRQTLEEMMRFILSLYRVRVLRRVDVPEFVEDVYQAVKGENKPELRPHDGNWDTFKGRLDELLRYEQSLGITAKALDVMSQHEHVYVNEGTRIMTDVRPVFPNALEQLPSAAVIIHTLKLVYHEGSDHKEFFIALDTSDVRELRELLDRADQKSRMLQTILKDTPMQYLDSEVH